MERDLFRETLTNEKLKLRFKSQFDLVNYAIKLATEMIQSGRGPRVKTDIQNVALLILMELNAGRDQFDDYEIDEDKLIEIAELQAAR